jgi:DNA-binding phage protein
MATTTKKAKTAQDSSYHDQRLARRLQEDPEFRAEFERQSREIAAIDAIVHKLEALREAMGVSKAELARAVGKNPAAIRRLLTASGNPELGTVVALADKLGAEVQLVPKKRAPKVVRQALQAA